MCSFKYNAFFCLVCVIIECVSLYILRHFWGLAGITVTNGTSWN